METTRLSTKGQVILPKKIRDARSWKAGTELTVEDTGEGILLRPAPQFPRTSLGDVAGCLKHKGKPVRLEEMDAAIAREVRRRHDRSRY